MNTNRVVDAVRKSFEGHAGRKGQRGGSAPKEFGTPVMTPSGQPDRFLRRVGNRTVSLTNEGPGRIPKIPAGTLQVTSQRWMDTFNSGKMEEPKRFITPEGVYVPTGYSHQTREGLPAAHEWVNQFNAKRGTNYKLHTFTGEHAVAVDASGNRLRIRQDWKGWRKA